MWLYWEVATCVLRVHGHTTFTWGPVVQVPFGRFAFMPGQLYHTNEILVLLGDNWFAERSAKQAIEIAERRKQCMYRLYQPYHTWKWPQRWACMNGLFQDTCLLVSDVIKLLEDEKKQFSDWEARYAFASDFKSTLEVCVWSAIGACTQLVWLLSCWREKWTDVGSEMLGVFGSQKWRIGEMNVVGGCSHEPDIFRVGGVSLLLLFSPELMINTAGLWGKERCVSASFAKSC